MLCSKSNACGCSNASAVAIQLKKIKNKAWVMRNAVSNTCGCSNASAVIKCMSN